VLVDPARITLPLCVCFPPLVSCLICFVLFCFDFLVLWYRSRRRRRSCACCPGGGGGMPVCDRCRRSDVEADRHAYALRGPYAKASGWNRSHRTGAAEPGHISSRFVPFGAILANTFCLSSLLQFDVFFLLPDRCKPGSEPLGVVDGRG